MATINLFTYSEIITAKVAPSSGRFSADSVGMLKNRYLARAQLTPTTGSPQSTTADLAPSGTTILQYMVEPGKVVYYEVFPEGYSGAITEATAASPWVSGTGILMFGPGWRISMLEASFA